MMSNKRPLTVLTVLLFIKSFKILIGPIIGTVVMLFLYGSPQENNLLNEIGERGLRMSPHYFIKTIASMILWVLVFMLPAFVGGFAAVLYVRGTDWVIRFCQNEQPERIRMARRAAECLLGIQLVLIPLWPMSRVFTLDPELSLLFVIAFARCLYISPDLFKGLLVRGEAK